jgi:hypothetical protein
MCDEKREQQLHRELVQLVVEKRWCGVKEVREGLLE